MYGWLYNSVSEFTQVVPIVCRVKNCCRPFVIFLKKLKFCKSWVRAWNNEKLNYENQHGLTKYRIECLNLKRNKLEYFQQACSKMEWCPHLFPPRVYLSISAISGSIMHLPWLPQWISFNHWWRDLKWFVTSGGEMSPSAWSAHQMRDGYLGVIATHLATSDLDGNCYCRQSLNTEHTLIAADWLLMIKWWRSAIAIHNLRVDKCKPDGKLQVNITSI